MAVQRALALLMTLLHALATALAPVLVDNRDDEGGADVEDCGVGGGAKPCLTVGYGVDQALTQEPGTGELREVRVQGGGAWGGR